MQCVLKSYEGSWRAWAHREGDGLGWNLGPRENLGNCVRKTCRRNLGQGNGAAAKEGFPVKQGWWWGRSRGGNAKQRMGKSMKTCQGRKVSRMTYVTPSAGGCAAPVTPCAGTKSPGEVGGGMWSNVVQWLQRIGGKSAVKPVSFV